MQKHKTSLIRILIFLLLILVPSTGFSAEITPYWPSPPDPTRIVYLESFSSPRDFKLEKNWWTKFWEFVLGEEVRQESLAKPTGIYVAKGRVYITDTALSGVHMFDPDKKEYLFFNKIPHGTLKTPVGIAVDSSGNLYVADSELGRVFIFSSDGKYKSEIGLHGELAKPAGLAVSPVNQSLYVADGLTHSIKVFDPKGKKTAEFGKRGAGHGEFNFPTYISIDKEGKIYVSDTLNFRVQVLDATGNYLLSFGEAGNMIGDFSRSKGIATDSDGNIHVVEGIFDVVQIFNSRGELLLVYGNGGGSEPGSFWLANGIYIDQNDKIYIADTANGRVQVFQYLPETE